MRRREMLAFAAGLPFFLNKSLLAQEAAGEKPKDPTHDIVYICPKFPYAVHETYTSYYATKHDAQCNFLVAVSFDGPPMATPVNCTTTNCPCYTITIGPAKKGRDDRKAVYIHDANDANGQLEHYADVNLIDNGLPMTPNPLFPKRVPGNAHKRWFTHDGRIIQVQEFLLAQGKWVHVAYDTGGVAGQGRDLTDRIRETNQHGDRSYHVKIDQTGGSNVDRDYHFYLRQ